MAITTAMCTSFKQELLGGVHDLDTHSLKIALIKPSPTGSFSKATTNYSNLTANSDEATGIQIINKAIESPLRTIVNNAGGEGSVVVNKVKEGSGDFGYNARSNVYENLISSGVIDPVKVTRLALENSASISGLLLTTECVIADEAEDPSASPAMGGGMPGGMPGMM